MEENIATSDDTSSAEPSIDDGADHPADRDDVRMLDILSVRRWITRLPGSLRRIFDFIYVLGFTHRETAASMGLSQPRVAELHQQLIQRGRAELTC
jgi:DNA-directed RNA polymerase specialized sigma24 family protein